MLDDDSRSHEDELAVLPVHGCCVRVAGCGLAELADLEDAAERDAGERNNQQLVTACPAGIGATADDGGARYGGDVHESVIVPRAQRESNDCPTPCEGSGPHI